MFRTCLFDSPHLPFCAPLKQVISYMQIKLVSYRIRELPNEHGVGEEGHSNALP